MDKYDEFMNAMFVYIETMRNFSEIQRNHGTDFALNTFYHTSDEVKKTLKVLIGEKYECVCKT